MRGRFFVLLPAEYASEFPEYNEYFGKPLLLDKGIYGMLLRGKYWVQEFSDFLTCKQNGFSKSKADPSLFIKHYSDGTFIMLIFYVDDLLYFGSDDKTEKSFEKFIEGSLT